MQDISDEFFMLQALTLAAKGGRAVMPNPMVGAVLVHQGEIIGAGYHYKYGEAHAEVVAIASVEDPSLLSKSTLYVTLEPCCHHGKTPPCTELIIKSKIPHVVFSSKDPFHLVQGGGEKALRDAGVRIDKGIFLKDAITLNKRFFVAHSKKRPYIILKWAQTKDGFIARDKDSSTWISSESARKLVHQWRAEECGILVGYNTARVDDPHLTVRLVEGKNPTRIVVDRDSTLPRSLNLFNKEAETIVIDSLSDKALSILHDRGILSLIVEGGAKTLNELLSRGLWDEARVFSSPQEFTHGLAAPQITKESTHTEVIGNDTLRYYENFTLSEIIASHEVTLYE